MIFRDVDYPSATGECVIRARIWEPEGPPRAVLQIAHGMAEHIMRYSDFAAFMCANGVLVAANDHAGHGRSMPDRAHEGWFAAENGWFGVVEDMRTLHTLLAETYTDIPHVLLGHSMGSFLARTYSAMHHGDFAAYIFSGTAGKNGALSAAKAIAAIQGGSACRKKSPFLNSLSFGAYNKPFVPNRTEFDWLSRDDAKVDAYVADPDCGFCFTVGGFADLFSGLSVIQAKDWPAGTDDTPILLMSGAMDPVGGMGKGVEQVAEDLRAAGRRVTLHLYPEGRHEMLNELNRADVYGDVLAFIETVI